MSIATKDISKMSFEDALSELEVIVNNLESGRMQLENAVDSYSRGDDLRKHCQQKLSEAKLKIEKLTVNDNKIESEDFS